MTDLPFSATTPIHIGQVGLKAHDAEALARFYHEVIGLERFERGDGVIALGAGTRPLLEIEQDGAARPDDPREAGLFHTAFLLPSRPALARWARHAIETGVKLDGASDHLVSEAIYLSDPDGNGIEIYADRPRERWPWEGGEVAMKTLRLDFDDLFAAAGEGVWAGAPEGTVIGHVHLRVGDPAQAEKWWHEAVGLETMARYGPKAVFLSSGGYHHHIGANSWHSAGAGRRDPARAGLSWLSLLSADARQEHRLEDPWGTAVRVVPQAHG